MVVFSTFVICCSRPIFVVWFCCCIKKDLHFGRNRLLLLTKNEFLEEVPNNLGRGGNGGDRQNAFLISSSFRLRSLGGGALVLREKDDSFICSYIGAGCDGWYEIRYVTNLFHYWRISYFLVALGRKLTYFLNKPQHVTMNSK